MADEKRRGLEREAAAGDVHAEARLVVDSMRRNETTSGCVQVLAFLDDRPAQLALGEGNYVESCWDVGESMDAWARSLVLLANTERVPTRTLAARVWVGIASKWRSLASGTHLYEHNSRTFLGDDLKLTAAWILDPSLAGARLCRDHWVLWNEADIHARGNIPPPPIGSYIAGLASEFLPETSQKWTGIGENLGGVLQVIQGPMPPGEGIFSPRIMSPEVMIRASREAVRSWLMQGAPDPRPWDERCGHWTIERLDVERLSSSERPLSYADKRVYFSSDTGKLPKELTRTKSGTMVCLACGTEIAPKIKNVRLGRHSITNAGDVAVEGPFDNGVFSFDEPNEAMSHQPHLEPEDIEGE